MGYEVLNRVCLCLWFVCFFLMYQETASASPVILRVDPKGFYLYWTYQNKVSVKIAQVGHQTVGSGFCKIKTQDDTERN